MIRAQDSGKCLKWSEGINSGKFLSNGNARRSRYDILGQNGRVMVRQLEDAGGDDHEGEYEDVAVLAPPPGCQLVGRTVLNMAHSVSVHFKV